MDSPASITVQNSASNVRTRDPLRNITPPSSLGVGSIHSSPVAQRPGSDSDTSSHPSNNQLNPLFHSGASELQGKRANNAGSTLVSTARDNVPAPPSIVSDKGRDLMAKWLPSATSALAEPLEQDGLTRGDPAPSKNEAAMANVLMTPPFTPLKRSEPAQSTPQPPQMRALDQLHPRSFFMTPPSTVKHEQINANRSRSPFSGLSPALRVPSRTSARGNSPIHEPHHNPYPMDSLAHHLSKLSPMENLRPRSLSSPMEPSFDILDPMLHQLFVSRPSVLTSSSSGLSSDEEAADLRKRADTFCSTSSAPFHPHISDVNSPAASSLLSQQASEASPVKLGRASQRLAGLSSFTQNAPNVYSNIPSPRALSKPRSHFSPTEHRSEDPATLLFPSSRHGTEFLANSSKPISASQAPTLLDSSGNERHQRYHTAPAESSPLSQAGRSQLPNSRTSGLVGDGGNISRRFEERSMSLAGPSQTELLQSPFINVRFRPRSSTMADTASKKMFTKSLLSVNWEDSAETKDSQDENTQPAAWSAGSGPTESSARSPAPSVNFRWNSALSEADCTTFPGCYGGPLNQSPAWGFTSNVGTTRYCKVLGVPPKLLGSMKGIVRVRNAFAAFGDLLDIHVDTLSPVGFILVGFHDLRSVLNMIQTGIKTLERNFGSYLKMEPLQRSDVVHLTQDLDNPVLSSNEGALNLQFEDPRGIITEEVLVEYLQRYGDLRNLRMLGYGRWFVEWYDDRRAIAAQKELVARDFADFQVKVDVPESELHSILENHYPGAVARSLGGVGPNVCLLPPTIRPPAMINSTDSYNNSLFYRYLGDPYGPNYMFPWNQQLPIPPPTSLYNFNTPTTLSLDGSGCVPSTTMSSEFFGSNTSADQQSSPQPTTSNRPRAFPFPGVPPSNVMDLDRIECGSDPRTTCMIKNIPNKITDEMLFNFINEVCPRGFDFLYLRMDFKARLNVGYAFINFLSVENVLKFAKAKLGVKWGVFLSEKTVQMCYASIQGKENLIEKFRNSAIMEEEESFRPKVYHSSGPLIGLPERFPHANDLQRKARSQANAALLVRPPVSSINSINA